MSDQDCELLVTLAPKLMKSVIIDNSDLLVQLRARRALTEIQHEGIKVIKQYYVSFNFWGGHFLSRADKGRPLILEVCNTN